MAIPKAVVVSRRPEKKHAKIKKKKNFWGFLNEILEKKKILGCYEISQQNSVFLEKTKKGSLFVRSNLLCCAGDYTLCVHIDASAINEYFFFFYTRSQIGNNQKGKKKAQKNFRPREEVGE